MLLKGGDEKRTGEQARVKGKNREGPQKKQERNSDPMQQNR